MTPRWRTIVIDPPWEYRQRWLQAGKGNALTHDGLAGIFKRGRPGIRGAAAKYGCMTLKDIRALPVGEWAEDDAHLWLWTTNHFMVEAHECMKAWGFSYKTMLTWVKGRGDVPNAALDEEWREIPGHSRYQASSWGMIRLADSGRRLAMKPTQYGYMRVVLFEGKRVDYLVHRLVALAFHGEAPSADWEVDHRDDIKTNNCAWNLEWVTAAENMQRAAESGLLGRRANGTSRTALWRHRKKEMVTQLGMGMWLRNTTEHALFGVRGHQKMLRRDVPTHLVAPRGEHSRKPDAFYDMVETTSPGPWIDVFARRQRFGWACAGNEVYSAIPALAAR